MTPSTVDNRTEEEAAIRKVEAELMDTWNHHDARAWANLCTEDGDVVNVVGWWWQGRSQIEKKLADAHAYIFRESTLTDDEIQIRFLTSETAVVQVRTRKGIETQVLHKLGGKWLIAAFHNTDSRPEVPFPMGPPPK